MMVQAGRPIEALVVEHMMVLAVLATQDPEVLDMAVPVDPHIQDPEGRCIEVRGDPHMMALMVQLTPDQGALAIAARGDLATQAPAVAAPLVRVFADKNFGATVSDPEGQTPT